MYCTHQGCYSAIAGAFSYYDFMGNGYNSTFKLCQYHADEYGNKDIEFKRSKTCEYEEFKGQVCSKQPASRFTCHGYVENSTIDKWLCDTHFKLFKKIDENNRQYAAILAATTCVSCGRRVDKLDLIGNCISCEIFYIENKRNGIRGPYG